MKTQDLADLRRAVKLIEIPSFGAKIADLAGTPIEAAIAMLPPKASRAIGTAAQKSVHVALKVAIKTMDHGVRNEGLRLPASSNKWHTAVVATTGAGGGFFGLTALAIELPITTTIMMRSIADIARSEGANLLDTTTQLECVQVLGLGGVSDRADATEVGYFVAREAMGKAVSDAATFLAKSGFKKGAPPALVKLINQIAQRFSIKVSEKAAAQLVPVIGAVGGALVNTIFIDHFQSVARGHFAVRRLEKSYGIQVVRQHYLEVKQNPG